jgi:1,4-dihydroxy-2-naphthoate octaprenyltransferase
MNGLQRSFCFAAAIALGVVAISCVIALVVTALPGWLAATLGGVSIFGALWYSVHGV